MGKGTTAIFDPKKPRANSTKVTKTSQSLPARPTDIFRSSTKPGLPLNKKHVPDGWAVIVDEGEKWPYPDPDLALARAEPEIDDVLPTDQDLPSSIIPYSEHEPWGRRSDETDTEYKYFLQYRSQGFNRELQAVAIRFNISRSHVGSTARRLDWHARAVAWDIERERVYTAEMLNGTRQMARKHVKIARKGLKALAMVFDEIDNRMDDPAFVAQLSSLPPKTLIALAQRSAAVIPNLMQAERLARNLPTEITSVHVDHDIRSQSLDDIAEIVAAFVTSVPRPQLIEGTVVEDDAGEPGPTQNGADSEAQ